jgi:hypothetical protein
MRESDEHLHELQELLDRSYASAGVHLRSIFDEEHRLNARELAHALDGIFEMHLATLAGDGAPLVAPIDGIFCQGKIWFGLPADSLRARLVRRDARVSASYTQGSFAFIAHGTAREAHMAEPAAAEFRALAQELYVAQYGPAWVKWAEHRERTHGPGYTGWIEPRVLFAKR